MSFNPIVIEKGLSAKFAQSMMQFQAARKLSPGLMATAMEVPSTSAYEKYGWLGAIAAVQQWIGELSAKEIKDYEYTLKNLDWAAGVPVFENDYDDDQTGSYSLLPQMLAQRINAHPEKLIADLAINGDTLLAYDSVAFFSDVSSPRTIDNLLAGTGTTLAQLEVDLNAALVAMAKFPDDQGEILNIKGTLVYCPVALERKFKRLVKSETDPTATVEGTFNPYKDIDVIADARLDVDDADDWYLFATGEIVKPFIWQMRQKARAKLEKTPHTKRWVFSADYRGNGGYGLPHLAVKTVN